MSVCVFRELTKTIRVRCLFSLDPLFLPLQNARARGTKKKPHAPSTSSTSSAHARPRQATLPRASARASPPAPPPPHRTLRWASAARGTGGGRTSQPSRRGGTCERRRFIARATRTASPSRDVRLFLTRFSAASEAGAPFPLRDVQKPSGHHRRKRRRLDLMHHQSLSVVRTFSRAWSAKTSRRADEGQEPWRHASHRPPTLHRRRPPPAGGALCVAASRPRPRRCARGGRTQMGGALIASPTVYALVFVSPSRRTSAPGTALQPPGRCRRDTTGRPWCRSSDVRTTGRPAPNRASACARGRT